MLEAPSVGMASPKLPEDWDWKTYLLYNRDARNSGAFTESAAREFYVRNQGVYRFDQNAALPNKDHVVTLLGYSRVADDGARHTNWFPWNRFRDAIETIGYACEWCEVDDLKRGDEDRIFVTWNEPTSLDLFHAGQIREGDIVLQKLTSLGKGMEKVDWTADARAWSMEWEWPIYRTVEYLSDIGMPVYAFGCRTDPTLFPEKRRIVERLADRIFWIPWGGTPFSWEEVLAAEPKMDDLAEDVVFVGSKWGRVGRGNVDAWERYLAPFERSKKVVFTKYGGIDEKIVSDEKMVALLRKGRICPIVHAPSWQAEHGVQDRFYTVFLSGRFGICDNLGAVDLFGKDIANICTEVPEDYFDKSLHFLKNVDEQLEFITYVQDRIKKDFNFYVTWLNILSGLPDQSR